MKVKSIWENYSSSRGECIVLDLAADTLACVVCFWNIIIEIQLIESICKGEQHQAVNEEKFEDVQKHSAKGDLKRAQVGVGCEE